MLPADSREGRERVAMAGGAVTRDAGRNPARRNPAAVDLLPKVNDRRVRAFWGRLLRREIGRNVRYVLIRKHLSERHHRDALALAGLEGFQPASDLIRRMYTK